MKIYGKPFELKFLKRTRLFTILIFNVNLCSFNGIKNSICATCTVDLFGKNVNKICTPSTGMSIGIKFRH